MVFLHTVALYALLASPQNPTCQVEDTHARAVAAVLTFPEPGLDDSASYRGYRTRFIRDAVGNTVQVYVNQGDGRVVHLWANAANESIGFTARDGSGMPAALSWASDSSCVYTRGDERVLEYTLTSENAEITLGHFLLGSMRVERDFQYGQMHLRAFDERFELPELRGLIASIERLTAGEQQRHLTAFRSQAQRTLELHDRG